MIKGALSGPPARAGDAVAPPLRLDPLAKRIIAMLQVDGRRSTASMAASIGTAESVVAGRLDDLLRTGVVDVAPVGDPGRLGFGAQAMLGLVCEPGQTRSVVDRLAEREEFVYVLLTSGVVDAIAVVLAEDRAAIETVIGQVTTMAGVADVHTSHYTRYEKLIYTWDVLG